MPIIIRRSIFFGLDFESRTAARNRRGDKTECFASEWSHALDPDRIVALYATFSNANIRHDREAVLAELRRVAREEFQGQVTRNMVASLYIAQRGGSS